MISLAAISGAAKKSGSITYTTTESFDFPGTNEYIDCGDVSGLDLSASGTYTFCAWVKPDAFTGNAPLAVKRDGTNAGWSFYMDSLGRLRFLMEDTSANLNLANSNLNRLSTGSWQHIMVTVNGADADNYEFYIDNSNTSRNTDFNAVTGGSSILNTAAVQLGGHSSTSAYADGHIYDIAIFSTVFDSTERSEAYNSGTPIDYNDHSESANLIAYWRFGNDPDDDATATTGVIKDRVGGFDGTPTNTAGTEIVTDSP